MSTKPIHISQRPLRTPRAAATAGIVFAILQIISFVLLQVAIPPDSFTSTDWLVNQVSKVSLALGLMPFAGIAFLWFMGVVRDRLGYLEDQFFSTLFFGSGLLYLAMTFASAAIAGGMLAVYAFDPGLMLGSGFYLFGRAIIFKFSNVYAVRMAGMFILSLGTIWYRTNLMPRWLSLTTYVIGFVLLIGISYFTWMTVFFPAWVFLTSAYILLLNYRYEQGRDGVTLNV